MADRAPVELLGEDSIAAGVHALETLHGHHLADMTASEGEAARAHWRGQVELILHAVFAQLAGDRGSDERGRAVLAFTDDGADGVTVSATFLPRLRELPDGDLDGTPAQVVAMASLQALEDEVEDPDEEAAV